MGYLQPSPCAVSDNPLAAKQQKATNDAAAAQANGARSHLGTLPDELLDNPTRAMLAVPLWAPRVLALALRLKKRCYDRTLIQ
jgi:hypothetical protein